jgi:hypothetical protein
MKTLQKFKNSSYCIDCSANKTKLQQAICYIFSIRI